MVGEIVDTHVDPHAFARERRGRWVRLAFPFLTSMLLIAAIIAITVYTERVNRRDALALSRAVVTAFENSVRRELEAYLAPTKAAVLLLAEAAGERGISGRDLEHDRALLRTMRRSLRRTPELAALFVGDDEGDFLMVQRTETGLLTKTIGQSDGPRVVRFLERARGGGLSERFDADDAYDPRTRPWFTQPRTGAAVVFSDVYRFFSTKRLGITASVRASNRQRNVTVAGGDLDIEELNGFLETLDLGTDGRAVIVDESGQLIASNLEGLPLEGDVPTVAAFGDPVLAEAFQRFRIARGALGLIRIDERRYLISAASLEDLISRPWWVLLIAHEESFVGFVEENARTSLVLSGIVVLLATLVGGLLTFQGIQSDARAARARRSEQAVVRQRSTLEALAGLDQLGEPTDEASLRGFAVIAADAAGARRTAIWWHDAANGCLINIETFDREVRGHTAAATLRGGHLPESWSRLLARDGWTLTAEANDAAAREIKTLYLAGVGSSRLDVVPVVRAGELLGSVWFEDAEPTSAVILSPSLAMLMASMLVPRLDRLRATGRPSPASRAQRTLLPVPEGAAALDGEAARGADIAIVRDRVLLRRLQAQDGDATLASTLHPRVAVLYVRLGDALALAGDRRPAARTSPEAGLCALVDLAQTAADRLQIPYLKLLGDVLVAADGCANHAPREGNVADGEERVAALADLALELQPACRRVAASGARASFRMGLDVGPAFGAAVGVGHSSFNLWGEAPKLAERMATTAPPTVIQVTEAAYTRLAAAFLMRRRGSFFIDGVGETTTFVLAGRL